MFKIHPKKLISIRQFKHQPLPTVPKGFNSRVLSQVKVSENRDTNLGLKIDYSQACVTVAHFHILVCPLRLKDAVTSAQRSALSGSVS